MYPENSIPGFIYAIDQGVNTLELDLCVTKDRQLVVSHEPVISTEICFDTTGNEIPDSLQMEYNIFNMTYNEVSQFDCGSKVHPNYPNQKKIFVNKPLLTDVINTVAMYLQNKEIQTINYNIEIKSKEKFDSLFHPPPKVFSDLCLSTCRSKVELGKCHHSILRLSCLAVFPSNLSQCAAGPPYRK